MASAATRAAEGHKGASRGLYLEGVRGRRTLGAHAGAPSHKKCGVVVNPGCGGVRRVAASRAWRVHSASLCSIFHEVPASFSWACA